MATVFAEMSMSLDGFVADSCDQVGPLFDWYANGEVEVRSAFPDRWTFRASPASAAQADPFASRLLPGGDGRVHGQATDK